MLHLQQTRATKIIKCIKSMHMMKGVAMRNIPVDQTRTGEFKFVGCEPKFDDGGIQRTTERGRHWTVEVLNQPPQGEAPRKPRAAVEVVTVVSNEQPTAQPMQPVTFLDLAAREWAMNGNHGVSLSASGMSAARSASAKGAE